MAVTNAVSWRSEGIRYRKNEVFLDVVESVNMLVNAQGNVVRSEILGAVKMKCYLSGMPELRLGLNDKVMFETTGRAARGKSIEMEDVKFHQCVRLSRFENDRTISFIPPDGEFTLMSYRLSTPVKPLIWAEASVETYRGSRIEFMVKVRGQFKRRSTANNVKIFVPVPEDADSPKFRAAAGSVVYMPEKSCFCWTIKNLVSRALCSQPSHKPSRANRTERRSRASHARTLWPAVRHVGRGRRQEAALDPVRDPVLYPQRHQRALPQDCRQDGLHCGTLPSFVRR
jgi:AP-1 complex subunit mu